MTGNRRPLALFAVSLKRVLGMLKGKSVTACRGGLAATTSSGDSRIPWLPRYHGEISRPPIQRLCASGAVSIQRFPDTESGEATGQRDGDDWIYNIFWPSHRWLFRTMEVPSLDARTEAAGGRRQMKPSSYPESPSPPNT